MSDWKTIGKLLSSKNRRKVFYSLYDGKMPSEVSRETGLASSNVSKMIKELEELGLVRCVNSELRKGRVYKYTKKGKEIYQILKKRNKSSS